MSFNLADHSHRRFNPLTGEWVHQFANYATPSWYVLADNLTEQMLPEHDPDCEFCPGNSRSCGETNPQYIGAFSFSCDCAEIDPMANRMVNHQDLIISLAENGICKIISLSPRHDLSISEMSIEEVIGIVKTWVSEFKAVSQKEGIKYVQIFENKGSIGSQNRHPHSHIWGQQSIPSEPFKKQYYQLHYFMRHKTTMLQDYCTLELQLKERIVDENQSFVSVVPFWAMCPFETMIMPRRPMSVISDMTEREVADFADIYRNLVIRYDNLFQTSFPYSSGFFQAPIDGLFHDEWHWHVVFHPPLFRSASTKKFVVGNEMITDSRREITPEEAALKLRAASTVHYKHNYATIL